jgi:hypothetical protein
MHWKSPLLLIANRKDIIEINKGSRANLVLKVLSLVLQGLAVFRLKSLLKIFNDVYFTLIHTILMPIELQSISLQ